MDSLYAVVVRRRHFLLLQGRRLLVQLCKEVLPVACVLWL